MLKKLSRKLSKLEKSNLSKWDSAISDARRQLRDAELRVGELKYTIQTFKELRDSGALFPGEAKTDVAQ